jgi:hypothetical protein
MTQVSFTNDEFLLGIRDDMAASTASFDPDDLSYDCVRTNVVDDPSELRNKGSVVGQPERCRKKGRGEPLMRATLRPLHPYCRRSPIARNLTIFLRGFELSSIVL